MAENVLETSTAPLPQRLAAGLSKISLSIKRRGWQDAMTRRVSPLQAQVLGFLRQQPAHAAPVSAIAEALAVTLPTTSEVVATLVKKGILRKVRADGDGRVVMVHLTAKGRRRADQVTGWPDFLALAAELLPPQEQEALLRTLLKLIRAIQERGEMPVAKMCVTCSYFRPHVHDDSVRPHHCALVDAPFGDKLLRIDCPDHVAAPRKEQDRTWQAFLDRRPMAVDAAEQPPH